jgi:NTP pyrophosphatase (non-canonical NTP hydrolase)
VSLVALADEIREVNLANGWDVMEPRQWGDTYKVPAILALIHTEVSEALEAFRDNDPVNFREELADVLIRVLDLAAGLEFDMDSVVASKLEENRHRGFRHGGKRL